MFIDTHTHLYGSAFDSDREQALQRCIENQVTRLYLPGIDLQAAQLIFQLKRQYPSICFPMVGLHPCAVDAAFQSNLDQLTALYSQHQEDIVAIGEIGLDHYHDTTFAKEQGIAFRIQIEWALQAKLPIVLHVRNAFDETIAILKEYKSKQLRGIFHCFPGNLAKAKEALSMGDFKLGVGGIVTFKNSDIQEVVRELPLAHFVLETDAPYLAPVPHRGQRNESAYIPIIAQKIAEIKNTSIEEVALVTTNSALAVFHP